MGLVDYSDSDSDIPVSDSEAPVKTQPPSSKKSFQKVVDRSNPGKIVVNLPQTAAAVSETSRDEPPAKRARTEGGGRFSGFSSFLPAPKNANATAAKPTLGTRPPGVNLRTSAAPGFSRDTDDEGPALPGSTDFSAPVKQTQPSIPEGQKSADDVKLVGKPLMFKPLSVARNTTKKKTPKTVANKVAAAPAPSPQASQQSKPGIATKEDPAPAPPKKVSLFSMHAEEPSEPTVSTAQGSTYEPVFQAEQISSTQFGDASTDYPQYADYAQSGPAPTTAPDSESLDSIADEMNLSATARRELFGREGGSRGAKRVINFNMDKEYQHNEDLRAAGEEQIHNPVRAIQGGKHSLKQLVQNVTNQREALEDSFAKGKTNRKEASSKYGW